MVVLYLFSSISFTSLMPVQRTDNLEKIGYIYLLFALFLYWTTSGTIKESIISASQYILYQIRTFINFFFYCYY